MALLPILFHASNNLLSLSFSRMEKSSEPCQSARTARRSYRRHRMLLAGPRNWFHGRNDGCSAAACRRRSSGFCRCWESAAAGDFAAKGSGLTPVCRVETGMKYLHTNDRAKCIQVLLTGVSNSGYGFGITAGSVCNRFARIPNSGLDYKTNGLHASLRFERNGLVKRHLGLDTWTLCLDFGWFGLPTVCITETMQTIANQLGWFGYSCPPMSFRIFMSWSSISWSTINCLLNGKRFYHGLYVTEK